MFAVYEKTSLITKIKNMVTIRSTNIVQDGAIARFNKQLALENRQRFSKIQPDLSKGVYVFKKPNYFNETEKKPSASQNESGGSDHAVDTGIDVNSNTIKRKVIESQKFLPKFSDNSYKPRKVDVPIVGEYETVPFVFKIETSTGKKIQQ